MQVWSENLDPVPDKPGPFVETSVQIVVRPVTPPPDHAYALLAAQGQATDVGCRCVRFAWSPFLDRITLLKPDNLLGNSVRGGAIFRWLDAVMPASDNDVDHAVQKIAPSGSTHWALG